MPPVDDDGHAPRRSARQGLPGRRPNPTTPPSPTPPETYRRRSPSGSRSDTCACDRHSRRAPAGGGATARRSAGGWISSSRQTTSGPSRSTAPSWWKLNRLCRRPTRHLPPPPSGRGPPGDPGRTRQTPQVSDHESHLNASPRRPVLDFDVGQLAPQTGTVRYIHGSDPAHDIQVWARTPGGYFHGTVGTLIPSMTTFSFPLPGGVPPLGNIVDDQWPFPLSFRSASSERTRAGSEPPGKCQADPAAAS